MNNIILNNQCKLVNTVWIDRGIILTLIYYITKKYNKLFNKIIIINNNQYRKFIKYLFPRLKLSAFKNHSSNNFYFNIRTIIYKQNIIIDYLKNYNEYIHTKKIKVIPYYDINDVIVSYNFDLNKKLKLNPYINFLDNFKCIRGNYNNQLWDNIIENKILYKYKLFNQSLDIYTLFNNYIKSNYTFVNNSKIYYLPVLKENNQINISVQPEPVQPEPVNNNLTNLVKLVEPADYIELIKLLTTQINIINQLINYD